MRQIRRLKRKILRKLTAKYGAEFSLIFILLIIAFFMFLSFDVLIDIVTSSRDKEYAKMDFIKFAVTSMLTIAVPLTIIAGNLWVQRTFNGLHLLWDLVKEFESNYKNDRRSAAKYLLEKEGGNEKSLIRLLDFFEGVALLWEENLWDTKYVWFHFYGGIMPYYEHPTTKKIIERERQNKPAAWRALEEMYEELNEYEIKTMKGHKSTSEDIGLEKIKEALMRESMLE